MAWKKLGAADLSAATLTTVYTVPSTTEAIVNVNLCNRSSAAITARLALAEGATPGNEDYIEYDVSIPANGVLERTGIHMDTTLRIVAYVSAGSVSVVVNGNERSTA